MNIRSFINHRILSSLPNKELLKSSFTYIGSDVLNKILPFLLLPIITRYLSPEDYGTISVFTSIVGFLSVFVGLGSQELVQVYYFRETKEKLKYYIGDVLIITIITSIVYLVGFIFIRNYIFQEYGLSFIWLFLAITFTFGDFSGKIISIIWIAEGKSTSFAKYQNLGSLLVISTTVLFVVALELGWRGRLYSLLMSSFIFSIIAFYLLYTKGFIAMRLDFKQLKKCATESMGVLPYSVSFWFKNSALLLIMAATIGKHETGIYTVAMGIALLINFVTNSLNKVWQPLLYKMLANNKVTDAKIVKSIYIFMLLIILAGISLILFSDILVKLALAPEFHSATKYVRLLVVSITLQSLFTVMADYLIFYKEGKKLTFASISGIVVQYILIFIFIYFENLTVPYIITALIITNLYTLIISWIMVHKVRSLPWLFFVTKKQLN